MNHINTFFPVGIAVTTLYDDETFVCEIVSYESSNSGNLSDKLFICAVFNSDSVVYVELFLNRFGNIVMVQLHIAVFENS